MGVFAQIAPRGSVLWLAYNQLKREFRFKQTLNSKRVIIGRIILVIFMIAVCFGSGMAFKMALSSQNIGDISNAIGLKVALSFATLVFMSFLTSSAYLTDRSDLDLLISAPIAPKKIIKARLLVSSWRATSIFLYMYSIFILLSAITISPKYFSYIPISLGLSLFEGGIVFFITRFMLVKFGLRLGRNILMIIGVIGLICFATYFQISNLSSSMSPGHFINHTHNIFLEFLGNAILGNWLNAISIFTIGVLVFTISLELVGRSFAKDIGILVGQENLEGKSAKQKKSISFRRNLQLIFIHKELISIIRDPMIWVQIIAPLIGFIPLTFIIVKDKNSIIAEYMAVPLVIFMLSTISGTIAWMIMSVEEARELLVSAPISNNRVLINKGIAAAIMPLTLLLILSSLIIYIKPVLFLYCFFFGILTIMASIGAEFTYPKISKRPKMMQKPDRSMIGIILSLIFAFMWAAVSGLSVYSIKWGALATLLALIVCAILILPEFMKKTSFEKLLGQANT